jgi:hypothetical protein
MPAATPTTGWSKVTLDDLGLSAAERTAADALKIGYGLDSPRLITTHRHGLDGLVARSLVERHEAPGRTHYGVVRTHFAIWDETYNTLGWME